MINSIQRCDLLQMKTPCLFLLAVLTTGCTATNTAEQTNNQTPQATAPQTKTEIGKPDGWVRLLFSVETNGAVTDIVIYESSAPEFDESAINALNKMTFKPKIVDGKPVKQTGMSIQLDFTLDETQTKK